MQLSVSDVPSAEATPEPTLAPGVACDCLPGACFNTYDRDSDGCLSAAECALQKHLGAENCSSSAWDQDGDGCIDMTTEWPHIFDMYNGEVCPVNAPRSETHCAAGFFLQPDGVCDECFTGSTRRRRALECSACPTGTFDAGRYDDCLCGLFTAQDHQAGATTVHISSADGFSVDDRIVITGLCANESSPSCNTTQWESVLISAIAGNEITIGNPLQYSYLKYSSVRIECTIRDGTDLSHQYRSSQCGIQVKQCGCGAEACDPTTKCDLTDPAAPNGRCAPLERYPAFSTPAPTVGAKGDPHLVNLAGEHFDINHGGTFMLLRFPQDTSKPADVEINALVEPEWGKPCITYITQVELSGKWLNGQRVQVRCFLREHSEIDQDTEETVKHRAATFLGMRTLDEGDVEAPWVNITDAPVGGALSHPDSDVEVKLIKSQWFPKSKHQGNNPGVAGQFQFNLRDKRNTEAAKIVIRQDLPGQEHLNMAIRRLSVLGRADVGGLLGFDKHPESLERGTAACNHWRSQHHYEVAVKPEPWKQQTASEKWKQISDERSHKAAQEAAGMPRGDAMTDNEAGASLQSRDIDDDRDVFDDRDAFDDRDVFDRDFYEKSKTLKEQYAEAGLSCSCPADTTVYSEGVLTEVMSPGMWAEATWD